MALLLILVTFAWGCGPVDFIHNDELEAGIDS